MNTQVEIPYGCYWSTPFAKWQGALQHLNSIEFAAAVCKGELASRKIDPQMIDHGILGLTVAQKLSFQGLPWLTGLAGMDRVAGQTLSQVCATGVRTLLSGVQEINSGMAETSLIVAADRCSNGPHVYFPAPAGPGGTGSKEDIVLDNFSCDALGKHSMLQTAENVAAKHGISTEEQHEVVLMRQEQYQDALADNRAFQKRYMTLPFEVPHRSFKKVGRILDGDEGLFLSTAEGLANLRPVMEGGSVTFGGQTHPADGNAALIVATSEKAQSISHNKAIKIEALGFGQARVDLGYMPEAPVPAAYKALENAGIGIDDLHSIKTHNPFAVNDIVLSRQTGLPIERINNYGCSLIWGHPQGPTGTRSIIELIEELVLNGGGYGLFTGCAAGDTGMAAVIRVSDR
jgi:acetyl-CoA acetyltransferase family protein